MKLSSVSRLAVAVSLGFATTSWGQSRVAATARPDAPAAQSLLTRRITIELDRVPLATAIDSLATSAHVRILFRMQSIDPARPLSLRATNETLGAVLDRVLMGTGMRVVPSVDNAILLLPAISVSVTQGIVTGHVVDAKTRAPLVRANVSLDGATRGILTGDNGEYRLPGITEGTHVVAVKAIGYGRQTRQVTVGNDAVQLDIALEPSVNALDQVVVTGTVIPTEQRAVPNAMTVITAAQIEQRGITKIDQLFHGDVPGLFAQNRGANPSANLDEVTMYSRGTTALSQWSSGVGNAATFRYTNPIKTYVDGVEMANAQYLSQIDPKSIERIEILTGPQASTIYGSDAINGVMQIFTKRGGSSVPQLTLNAASGWVENSYSTKLTPQH